MVPAARVARDLGLNRKTVLKYYTLIREGIARVSRGIENSPLWGTEFSPLPVHDLASCFARRPALSFSLSL
jgi:hypothetical protein